ncbi:hypothetical protein BH10ACT11_BH10ACT11_05310 [soil metagenome]
MLGRADIRGMSPRADDHCSHCNSPVSRRMGRISVSGETLCGQCYMTMRGPLGVEAIVRSIKGDGALTGQGEAGPFWSHGS